MVDLTFVAGGSSQSPTSGALGQNVFVWATAPTIIIRDGIPMMKNTYNEDYYKTNNYENYLNKSGRYEKLAIELIKFFDCLKLNFKHNIIFCLKFNL